jgi:hypothetical protein
VDGACSLVCESWLFAVAAFAAIVWVFCELLLFHLDGKSGGFLLEFSALHSFPMVSFL